MAITGALVLSFLTIIPAEGGVSLNIPRIDDIGSPERLFENPSAVSRLARIDGFVQRTPHEGATPLWPTVVHLGYDERNLYILYTALDASPSRIRASLTSRETFEGDDNVVLLLDTFQDQQRAYAFRINPLGVQWDAIWSEAGGFDSSFDTVWKSGGRITEDGYQAWMAIPWKSLRFPPGEEHRFGLILGREVPRDEEETSYWPHVRSEAGWLHQAALLTGMRGISSGRDLQLIPFSVLRAFELLETDSQGGDRRLRRDREEEIGVDAKLVFRDHLVLDTTVNPDFSQIESDEPQITVNRRFETFFPERRPFFLENADLFATPLNLLFTRRITDPQLGLRFTGKSGPYSFGALLADDEAPGKLASSDSPVSGEKAVVGVVRAIRDFAGQSRLGVLHLEHELAGRRNRTTSLDGRWRLDPHWFVSGQVATSTTREASGDARDGTALEMIVSREGRRLNYAGGYREIGDEFEPPTGFLPRTGIRETRHFLSHWFWSERPALVFWGPELSIERVWDSDGTPLDSMYEASLEWHFRGPSSLEINYGTGSERLREDEFPVAPDDREFPLEFWGLEYSTAFSGRFEIEGELYQGRGINFNPPSSTGPMAADVLESEIEIVLRPLRRLRVELIWLHSRLDDYASGDRILDGHILQSRFNLQLSRELSARVITRLERLSTDRTLSSLDRRNDLNLDVLVTYRLNPWTAVFAGYNGNYREADLIEQSAVPRGLETGRIRDAQQLFLKVSYLIRP